jgi:hypothetical protein
VRLLTALNKDSESCHCSLRLQFVQTCVLIGMGEVLERLNFPLSDSLQDASLRGKYSCAYIIVDLKSNGTGGWCQHLFSKGSRR